jgi:hypothetical protein
VTLEEAQRTIEAEFQTARQARHKGNEGMVRVCARRAAGAAIGFWLETHPGREWGLDVMSRLRELAAVSTLPPEIRNAAVHLAARVQPGFALTGTDDLLDDTRTLIRYLLGDDSR